MANSIIGQILAIGEPQNLVSQSSGAAYTKRSVIVSVRRYDPNTGEPVNDFENTPEFSFIGDRCKDLDQFSVGQNVCVYFDIVGRKYTPQGAPEKIINDIRPYKIEPYGRSANQQTASTPTPAPQSPAQNPNQVSAAPVQPAYQPQPQSQPQAGQAQSGGFNPPI